MSELLEIVDSKQKSSMESFIEHAPLMAMIFANIGVAFGEWRVYDVVFNITGSVWKALGAILSTGVPFLLWEFLWQYRIANAFQRVLAVSMAGVAFITALLLGLADFQIGIAKVPTLAVLNGVVLALAVHVLAAFLFFYLDPSVSSQRKKATLEAEYRRKSEHMALANGLLAQAEAVLAHKKALANRFGKAEVEAIVGQLAGKTTLPTVVDAPVVHSGNGKASKEDVKESVPTQNFR